MQAQKTEPVFVNVYGAQESIPKNRFRQAGNRILGSLKGLKIRALKEQTVAIFFFKAFHKMNFLKYLTLLKMALLAPRCRMA
jgi:hypothetical protein